MDIHRILVVDDYSQTSRPAVDAAISIAKQFDSEIMLLHAWHLPNNVLPEWVVHEPGSEPQPIYTLARARAARSMETTVAEVRQRYSRVSGRAEQGEPEDVIVDVAGRGFDLVVMATHGRTGLSHMWNGSVAERVLRRVTCPVMIVHAGEVERV